MKKQRILRIKAAALTFGVLIPFFVGCQPEKSNSSVASGSSSSQTSPQEVNSMESNYISDNTSSAGFPAASGGQRPDSSSKSGSAGSSGGSNDSGASGYKLPAGVTAKATFTGKSATPNFTEKQKEEQKEAGAWLLEQIRSAAQDLSQKSYTIPKGNYGFDMLTSINGINTGAVLMGIRRPDNNPFTINADGVTFWFELSGLPCASVTRSLYIADCSNLIIKGLTLDAYSANSIEGSISQIDEAGNRIAIKLYDGTMKLDAETIELAVGGSECRIAAFKPNGDLIAPLYRPNPNEWGPGALQISAITPKGGNEHWLTFKNKTLFNTITSSKWKETYGKNGTLEVGDSVSLIYGVVLMCVDNSKQITIDGLSHYVGKGGFWENGGYGDHTWKNCYFGGRPGTNRILGGEGNMSQGLRHGSTYDGLVFDVTTDDAINIHGFWSETVTVFGNEVTFNYAPVGIQAGDKAEFIDGSGKVIATRTVKKTPEANYNYNGFLQVPIEFTSAPPSGSFKVRWPASECDGWAIRNCKFQNVYQRILINSGSGVFENNFVLNNGSNLALYSYSAGGYEGGLMKDITIRSNVFYNSANHPNAYAIELYQTANWGGNFQAANISITDNVFVNCGKLLTATNVNGLLLKNNIAVAPLLYNDSVSSFDELVSNTAVSGYNKGNNIYQKSPAKLQAIIAACKNTSKPARDIVKQIRGLV